MLITYINKKTKTMISIQT